MPAIGSAPVWGLSEGSNGPAIAQSCGKRTLGHALSLNSGASAFTASPRMNRQPSLNDACRRLEAARLAGANPRPRTASSKIAAQRAFMIAQLAVTAAPPALPDSASPGKAAANG